MTVNLPKIGQRGRVVFIVIKKAQPLERAELTLFLAEILKKILEASQKTTQKKR